LLDDLIVEFDRALRTVFAPAQSRRPRPGIDQPETVFEEREKRRVAGLIRVDHVGEVCAQALYQGQALTARDPAITASLREAGEQETEHLAWTEKRLGEVGGRKSLLNPLWYAGALGIGLMAGRLGDRWSLGFLAETERQVGAHLSGHLERLPEGDGRSRAILEQMALDEAGHADRAQSLGAAELPLPVKLAMKLAAKVMTGTAARI
jgi:ubiquinone biosynthesis monooxygenase Coq7